MKYHIYHGTSSNYNWIYLEVPAYLFFLHFRYFTHYQVRNLSIHFNIQEIQKFSLFYTFQQKHGKCHFQ